MQAERLGCRPGRNQVSPISICAKAGRRAPPAPRDDGKTDRAFADCDAAAQPSACRPRVDAVRAILSRSTPFTAKLRPIIQPFPDLTLEAAFRRIVELLSAER